MKKLALVLTFVFGVAMIAPAFAVDKVTKKEVKKDCAATCAKAGTAACCAAAGKDVNATCPKADAKTTTPAKAPATKK
jgi:hypothetical protein